MKSEREKKVLVTFRIKPVVREKLIAISKRRSVKRYTTLINSIVEDYLLNNSGKF